MNRPDSQKQIEKRVLEASPNTVFITSDFFDIADTPAVNKALSRLAENGTIRRVIRGVYDRPHFSELLQEYAAPSMSEVAKAIARNYGWKITPCGDTALNLLGLSTQVPAVWRFVSDGPYRAYQVGQSTLRFQRSANRDLAGMSEKSAMVVQALKALGRDQIEPTHLRKLARLLSDQEKQELLTQTQHSTSWINETAKAICQTEAKE